jgi:molecular chaperone GrpE (heat shock protein)
LLTRLAKREASLVIAEASYDELLASNVEMYRFDSTEGEQTTKRRKLQDIKDQADSLQAEIDNIRRRLNGTGIVNMNLRRR